MLQDLGPELGEGIQARRVIATPDTAGSDAWLSHSSEFASMRCQLERCLATPSVETSKARNLKAEAAVFVATGILGSMTHSPKPRRRLFFLRGGTTALGFRGKTLEEEP